MTAGATQDNLEVWVLLVERPLDTGADLFLHWQELEAHHAARKYIEADWPDHAGPMPSDVHAAIEIYNHHHQAHEHIWLESRRIETTKSDSISSRDYEQARPCGPLWRRDFVRDDLESSLEWREVQRISAELIDYMNEPAISVRLREANRPRSSSSQVQAVLLDKARDLGFRDESRGLFAQYSTKGVRPDYYMEVGCTGVILEVERGKTTTNNMDFLDFWKCHICRTASFLILLVPIELRHNDDDAPKKEFQKVSSRLESFFFPENYTNVWGLVLVGY